MDDKGFTLIELLISMAILCLVLFLSTPFTSIFNKKSQLDRVVAEIRMIINFSKSQSLSRSHNLTLSPISKNNDWSKGMVLKDNEAIVYEWEWSFTGLYIDWKGFQSMHYLVFSPELRSSVTNGYFQIQSGPEIRQIVVNRLGRVKSRLLRQQPT